MSLPATIAFAASLLAGAHANPGGGDRELGSSWIDRTLEDLANLGSERPGWLGAEQVGGLTGVVVPDGNPGDPCTLELVQIDGDAPELLVWKGEIQGVDRNWWCGLHSIRALPKLAVGPGAYRLRVDGLECVLVSRMPPGEQALFPLQPARSAGLTIAEVTSGCTGTRTCRRRFHAVGEGYVDDEGCTLSQDDVARLRKRVLASRPGPAGTLQKILDEPDDYLASLGITDELISAHIPAIRAACVRKEWELPDGSMPSLSAELERLFTPAQLKLRLATYLLRVSSGSTQQQGVLVEIPGDPWIRLCTGSDAPECVPWLVSAGAERWFTLDRELSRAIADLAPSEGWMLWRLAADRDWRERIWSDAGAWGDLLSQVDEVLARRQFESIRGWSEMEQRAVPVKWSPGPQPSGFLPTMDLRPTKPGAFDALLVRPGTKADRDWADVASEYDRVERAARAQPWLQHWKLANSGRLGVFLPRWREDLADRRALAQRAWQAARLPGSPQFIVNFGISISPDATGLLDCGIGVLSEDGTLLILESLTARGPLASERPNSSTLEPRRFGVVRPKGKLEMHGGP